MRKTFNIKGFTLIELIIVIAVIALLAAATFVAVDPAKRIGMARDAQRWADVTAVADAINQYIADNAGTFPTSTASFTAGVSYSIMGLGTSDYTSAVCTASSTNASQGILLTNLVGTYLPTMPTDPNGLLASKGTGYYLTRTSAGRIRVGACVESTYATASIYVQR